MSQTNLLQKLASVGIVAFGAISVTAIVSAPVQAATLDGDTGFDDGMSGFIDQGFSAISPGPNVAVPGNFNVTFSPGLITQLSLNNGVFAPPLVDATNPTQVNLVGPAPVGNFQFLGFDPPVNPLVNAYNEFEYLLTNNIDFNFENGTVVTIDAGSTFLGEVDVASFDPTLAEGFEFEALASTATIQVGGETYTTAGNVVNTPDGPATFIVNGETFGFQQALNTSSGTYEGNFSVECQGPGCVAVPEPISIFGLLVVGGLGIVIKNKKQS